MNKKKLAIIIALILGVVAILSVIICVGVIRSSGLIDGMTQSPKEIEEMMAFAKAHDQQGCLIEALKRSQTCAQDASSLACQQRHKSFLNGCVKNAAPSPTLCKGTPTPADGVTQAPAILEAYTKATCARLGYDATPSCTQLAQLVALECQMSRIDAQNKAAE